MPKNHRKIAATDCSFIHKSGKKTYGIDYFYNSSRGKASKGLEISVVAIVDVDTHIGYSLSARQTPSTQELENSSTADKETESTPPQIQCQKQKKTKKAQPKSKSEKEETRIDEYLKQLQEVQPHLPVDVKHLVCDGFYTKKKFVSGVLALQLDVVGKLRVDADLRYLYTGTQKSRGAKRKYDGKVNLSDISKLTFVCKVESGVKLYTCVVYSVCLKRQIRLEHQFINQGRRLKSSCSQERESRKS
ncbi:MAG TPA: transposase [Nostocaceae cyanobacterium]|nr:transposase [Nostocaceae cyanobacterium]